MADGTKIKSCIEKVTIFTSALLGAIGTATIAESQSVYDSCGALLYVYGIWGFFLRTIVTRFASCNRALLL